MHESTLQRIALPADLRSHARAGVTVQLIAVGLATGDVALHKLYGWGRAGRRSNDTAYAEPLRILSMWARTKVTLLVMERLKDCTASD